MSDRTPQRPEQDPPGAGPGRGGGSVVLGIVLGVLFLAALFGLSVITASLPAISLLPVVGVVAYLVVAIVLAARRRTARFGAGLAIAIGVVLLVGAGVCVALASGLAQATPSHG